ncbi:divisome protein SepX/GlpR [Streptomyces winkii]|uniref:divisome protein SepX/GlpR n=1 Tax=Streptomyces winkii TaxID=3051178 RepID=UPI0028D584C1|nr:gephyrin-like molybdotransferase receptor GlpR [Streptomyces sp. DSM 40971]
MNSSGLIYAVIVGAWAAYLVPMWLRRQDELNESRPTERFSTAIRLLSGKAAMERRYAKEAERRDGEDPDEQGDSPASDIGRPADRDAHGGVPESAAAVEGADESVDVRAFADPKTIVGGDGTGDATEVFGTSAADPADGGTGSGTGSAERDKAERDRAERDKVRQKSKRAKVLARRRRTTMVLFLAFTAGTIVAAVGGLGFLWAPAAPGLLLSAYIVHLRVQERRRFAATMDKRRTEGAAEERHAPQAHDAADVAAAGGAETEAHHGASGPAAGHAAAPESAAPAHREQPGAADRRALVEQTDHAEWVDQQRHGDREPAEGWDPVPVPLPTYVSAPVAPRSTRGVDLEAPGTWSSARSSSASGEPAEPPAGSGSGSASESGSGSGSGSGRGSGKEQGEEPSAGARRGRGRRRTPLFDQYEDDDRPRAANE